MAPLLKGKLKDYLARFTKMVDGIKKNDEKLFLGFFPNPPATEREILEVENKLGYELDDSIKTFYRQCNGLQFFAIDRDAENFNPEIHKPLKKPLGANGYRLIESPGPTHSVGFSLIEKTDNPPFAFANDYGASWTDSKITDMSEYLETTLEHKGHVDSRKEHYDRY